MQCPHEVGHLGIADVRAVFLEGESRHDDLGAFDADAGIDHLLDGLLCHVGRHAVVDASAGEDDVRVITQHLRLMSQVVGIGADAVPANQAGTLGQEVPLGAGGLQDFEGVDADLVEDDCQFLHQGDVQVTLGVLDDLGGFGHLDAAGAMYAGGDNRLVKVAEGLRGLGRVAGDDFDDPGDRAFPVAGIDAFRALADVVILQPFQPGFLFEDRDADFFGGTGIDGGFVDDGGDLAGRVACSR